MGNYHNDHANRVSQMIARAEHDIDAADDARSTALDEAATLVENAADLGGSVIGKAMATALFDLARQIRDLD